MRNTLTNEPEKFVLKNTGIFLLADGAAHTKLPGNKGVVEVTLKDPKIHGVVNGGHTLHVIRDVRDEYDEDELADAYVRIHVLEGVDADLVPDMAEGLNRSMQVDDPSLANLKEAFAGIKKVMEGKPGEKQIAYRQGDPGNVDILLVLTFMAMFDIERYPDRKSHPNNLFGHQKSVLQVFMDDKDASFQRILKRLPEILRLSDRIQQVAFAECGPTIGKMRLSDAKTANRAGADRYKKLPAYFAGDVIGGKFQLGWLFPMLAAFRANVSRADWEEKGKLSWLVDPEELLHAVIGELVEVIKTEHQDNKYKPAEVGRRASAYLQCYSAVVMELAARGKTTT
jgi:hypothetical protein